MEKGRCRKILLLTLRDYMVYHKVCEPKPLKDLISQKSLNPLTPRLSPGHSCPSTTSSPYMITAPFTCSSSAIPHSDQDTDWSLSSLFCCHVENIPHLKENVSQILHLKKILKKGTGVTSSHTHRHTWWIHTSSLNPTSTNSTLSPMGNLHLDCFFRSKTEVRLSLLISQAC